MLKVAIDPNQTKITDYYKLLDKIESLASSSSEYGSIINEVDKIQRERLTMCHPELETEKFGSLFKQLLENITLNANKVPQARWHDHIIKKFSTSFLIYVCWSKSLQFSSQKHTRWFAMSSNCSKNYKV